MKINSINLISAFTCMAMVLAGCGAKGGSANLPEENNAVVAEANDVANEPTDITVDKTLDNAIDESSPSDTMPDKEDDLKELTYVDLQPILNNLDDVWGKNWLEWTVEDFANEFAVPVSTGYETEPLTYEAGDKTAQVNPDGSFSIGELGRLEGLLEVKAVSRSDYNRQYTRMLAFPGEMNEDSMTTFFKTCEGCQQNDCSKCRNLDCEGCNNNKCEDTDKKDCADCLIKNCEDLLKFWAITESCKISTEYGVANLSFEKLDDSERVTLSDFETYRDLTIMFESGYAGADFPHFFMSVFTDNKDFNGDYSSFTYNDVHPDEESPYNNPYARYDAEDENTIIELRKFLEDNGLSTKFFTMYSTWTQLYNTNNENLTEQQWLDRFGQYLKTDEF